MHLIGALTLIVGAKRLPEKRRLVATPLLKRSESSPGFAGVAVGV